ncbi:MAG TPA: hypothetical protein VLH15_08065 [Dehalococcoidales bacterium]|nr:hypothetical protein [Dehalococcoidales bacterium]
MATSLVREGKVLNLFGGKVTGIKWVGQKLAEKLNQDPSIAADMMKCVESWNHMEFQVEPASAKEIHITGPRFTDPDRIAELYQSGFAEEIQCCLFGYRMLEKVAGHIKSDVG